MKVLIAISRSSPAEDILRFAKQITRNTGDPLTLLTVRDHKKDFYVRQEKHISRLARDLLKTQELISRIRTGDPIKEIIQEAREGKYDILIMGEIHAKYLSHFFQATNTSHIAENLSCPIIIVKGVSRSIHRILLCDSGAGRSSVLSMFTTKLAEILEGEEQVTVLHVMSQISAGPGVPGKVLRASVDELIELHMPEGEFLAKDLHFLEQSGIQSISKVRHGLVVDEILAEAHRGDYDLIVIGAHQGKKWPNLLLEDLTHKILIQSDRPVMVV